VITVSFEHAEHRAMCAQLDLAEQQLGSVSASELVRVLAEAASVDNVAELLDMLGNDGKILADDSICIAIGADYYIDLIAIGRHVQRDCNQRLIWTSVTRLKLMAISRTTP